MKRMTIALMLTILPLSTGFFLTSCGGGGGSTLGTDTPTYTDLPLSYTDNGDGTITADATGLLWQKGENLTMNRLDAASLCDSLTLGGYVDWRLPDVKELFSIVDVSGKVPSIDTMTFPGANPGLYWSSNIVSFYSSYQWTIGFDTGFVQRGWTGNTPAFFRCVRGPGRQGSFSDNGNGTISDSTTGLMWQRCSAGQQNDVACSGLSSTGTLQEARDYCDVLSHGGYTDWRLPNIRELQFIADYSQFAPAVNITYFPNTASNDYWSSTPSSAQGAWYLDFYDGETAAGSIGSRRIRCVR